ncbi:hypothetical protein ACPF8X_01650 [Streptomyces sp. G35A]
MASAVQDDNDEWQLANAVAVERARAQRSDHPRRASTPRRECRACAVQAAASAPRSYEAR